MWGCSDAMNGMGGWMAGMAILWIVFVLVLLALGVAALVWLVQLIRRGTVQARANPERSDARLELDRRYATGEVSREEYLQRRDDLSG